MAFQEYVDSVDDADCGSRFPGCILGRQDYEVQLEHELAQHECQGQGREREVGRQIGRSEFQPGGESAVREMSRAQIVSSLSCGEAFFGGRCRWL